MKLKKGDKIEEITLPSIDGTTFNLEAIKGKKLWYLSIVILLVHFVTYE